MMHSLESIRISCPYCGQTIDLYLDCSVEQQEYIEDCAVCCQPITLSVDCSQEAPAVREDEC